MREGYDYVSVGNYVPKSKYETVNDAVKWSADLISKHFFTLGENKGEFAKKLETNLVSEIDKKINENSGITRRIWNIILPDEKHDIYSVNLENIIHKTLKELGLPELPSHAVSSRSAVSPEIFIGVSSSRHHKDVSYRLGHNNIERAIRQNKREHRNNYVQI